MVNTETSSKVIEEKQEFYSSEADTGEATDALRAHIKKMSEIAKVIPNTETIKVVLNDAELDKDASSDGYDSKNPRLNYDELKLKPGMDRYAILERIANGGLSNIYKAYDSKLDRDVAIKVMGRGLPKTLDSIEAEAKVVGRLQHPNIIEVYDFVKHVDEPGVFGEKGSTISFMIMEYLGPEKGCYESSNIEKSFDLQLISRTITEVASALDYLDSIGMKYQDTKPRNIIITPHGAKLIDFGTMSAVTELVSQKYNDDQIKKVGTAVYLSPEAAENGDQDTRGEEFSLAITAYKYIFGDFPFEHAYRYDLKKTPKSDDLQKLSDLGVNTTNLMRVFDKALQTSPADRYNNTSEFAKALKEVLEVPAKNAEE